MAREDACSALSARADKVILVGYASADAAGLRDRLGAYDGTHAHDTPSGVEELDVGGDVEPSDLTGQEIAVTEALAADTEVCFDSLTALLQYADRERAFQFLHSLGERCADSSARIHYHLDPDSADDRTVAALSTLMDAVVDVGADEVRVRPQLQKD
jgi:hypothetical protein